MTGATKRTGPATKKTVTKVVTSEKVKTTKSQASMASKVPTKVKPPAKTAAAAKTSVPATTKPPAKTKSPAKTTALARAISPATTKAPAKTKASNARQVVRALAGISTSAVIEATGHGWNYWLRALDKAGAATLPHREIVKLLSTALGLRHPWWLQMITVGYEQARGLRKPNQKPSGFVATVSRTVAVPINALYAAWQEGRRGDWLPDAVEVRRATKNKSMKITWPDGSGIDVNFYDKGGNKAVVAIEQARLPDPGAVATARTLWGSTLDRLKATLEGKG